MFALCYHGNQSVNSSPPDFKGALEQSRTWRKDFLMNENPLKRRQQLPFNNEIDRRFLLRGASAAAGLGLLGGPAVIAQTSTPEASPAVDMATPVPVEAGHPSVLDSDEHRMIMSFNVGHAGNEELWEERKDVLIELIQQNRPLILGTQEPLHIQIEYLLEHLDGYDYIGVSRQGNTEDEYNAIFYDTSTVSVEDQGTFWLSENPSEPGSMLPGEGHPRIATWGRFSLQGHSNAFYVVNTHLSFEQGAVERQVQVLLEQLDTIIAPNAEVIMTGDFNRPRMTHVWKMFQDAGFRDSWQLSSHEDGPATTFHGWEGLDARGGFEQGQVGDAADFQIDWVLHRPGGTSPISQPLLVQIDTYHEGDVYPSDHFPVSLMTLGDADFETDGLTVSPGDVRANDEMRVSATVTNSGQTGVAEVILYVDRLVQDSQWALVEAGQNQEVVFPLRLYAPGEHEVSIDLLPAEVVNVEGVEATLTFLDVEAAPYIEPGDVIPVTGRIENHGSYEGAMDVQFYVDDVLIQTSQLSIPPGSVREIGFVHGFEEPGAYSVTLGSRTIDVSVMEPIDETWKFSRGDEAEWSDPDFDDTGWTSAVLPDSWESHDDYTEDFVYGWYRQSITIPAEWEGQPLRILVGQIDDADKTYLNGELIGETGRFPDEEGGFLSAWNEVREYNIAPDIINYGAENIIAVRVYDDLGGGGIHGGPLGILPLDEDALEDEA